MTFWSWNGNPAQKNYSSPRQNLTMQKRLLGDIFNSMIWVTLLVECRDPKITLAVRSYQARLQFINHSSPTTWIQSWITPEAVMQHPDWLLPNNCQPIRHPVSGPRACQKCFVWSVIVCDLQFWWKYVIILWNIAMSFIRTHSCQVGCL